MKKILFLMVLLISSVSLVACKTDSHNVEFVTNITDLTIENQVVANNKLAVEPKITIPDGKEFIGWYESDVFEGNMFDFMQVKITKDTILYAKWVDKIELVKITFVFNNNTDDLVETINKNSLATMPKDLVYEGYTFDGWYLDEAFTSNKFDFTTYIIENITLYAKWNKDLVEEINVTFVLNNGSDDLVETINKNSLVIVPTDLVYDGYTFDGWYLDESFIGDKFDFTTSINEDITLYAKWNDDLIEYRNVTFVLNNGSDDVVVKVQSDGLVTPPTNIEYNNLYLGNWYISSDFEDEAWDFENNIITEDLTLYARWYETFTESVYQNMSGNGNFDDKSNSASNMGLEPNYFYVTASKEKGTIPGYYNNEIRMYVTGGLEFELHESFRISKVSIEFSRYNDTPGETHVTLGDNIEILNDHNNKLVIYDNLSVNYIKIKNTSTVTAERVYIKGIEFEYYQVGPDVIKEDDINRPHIDITEFQLVEKELGTLFTPPTLIATDIEDGELEVTFDDSKTTYNPNNTGIYYAFFYAIDSDDNITEVYITIIVREVNEINDYYNSIDELLVGNDLKQALNILLTNDLNLQKYSVGNESMEISDRDPNNFNNVYLIYNGENVRGQWNATNWNKEHVWAKSAFGTNKDGVVMSSGAAANDIGIMSDLHNLRAINVSVNSTHSNHRFADYTGTDNEFFGLLQINETLLNPYTPGKDTELTTIAYYPGNEHKGDVARILLYMHLVWEITPREDISMLVQWHLEDPVDNFEIIRNEVIYGYQNNRNPFIDNPQYIERIFAN